MDTTILLVDDHEMLRKGLGALLEREEGLRVIGEAGNGQEAVAQVQTLKPDIVVMDINMPELNGIAATREILTQSPDTRVLALSIHSGKYHVEEMLEAGASGYLLKENAPEELVRAIRLIKKGKGYLSPDITNVVLKKMRETTGTGQPHADKLIVNKLVRPRIYAEYVQNPQLLETLESGLGKRLTLVTASAKSGKTSLISAWLEQCKAPSAWLTLDKNDNNFRQFLKSWLEAIDTLLPAACPQLQRLTESANLPPVSVLAKSMADDLEQLPHHFIFVLDNYDQISSKQIHDLISALLDGPSSRLHLVLITTKDPFLALVKLRANNQLNEIRIQDLIPADDEDANWRLTLTNREYEILLLLEQRLRDKEIADKLSVSTETVKSHLKNIYGKLDAKDRRDVIVKAVKLGLLQNS